jgi:hypothetical protein
MLHQLHELRLWIVCYWESEVVLHGQLQQPLVHGMQEQGQHTELLQRHAAFLLIGNTMRLRGPE